MGVSGSDARPVAAQAALERVGDWHSRIRRAERGLPLLEQLGDAAGTYLVECSCPAKSTTSRASAIKAGCCSRPPHKYAQPPFETMHQGGVFSTRTLPRDTEEAIGLRDAHAKLLRALGMRSGVTHTEFLRAHADGHFYFLETAARVGGAYIAEVTEAGNRLNPWVEWARMEVAQLRSERYELPPVTEQYAGGVICLARQQWPDTFQLEVCYRLRKHHHAGLIVRADSAMRVESLLCEYMRSFGQAFYTRLDVPEKPTS